eukprot:Pgem_evm1s10785
MWDNNHDFLGEIVIPMLDFEAIGIANKLTVHKLNPKSNIGTLGGGDTPHDFTTHSAKVFTSGKCHVCHENFLYERVKKCKQCKVVIHETCSAYVGDHCQLSISMKAMEKNLEEL